MESNQRYDGRILAANRVAIRRGRRLGAMSMHHGVNISAPCEETNDKALEKQLGKEALSPRKHLAKTPEATLSFNEAVTGVLELRRLHVEMDKAVAAAYGWEDILLHHDFYEVDYLPETDRVRYTIHPEARRAVLKRLLGLNHQIHAEEEAKGLWEKKSGGAKGAGPGAARKKDVDASQLGLFDGASPPVQAPKRGRGPAKKAFSAADLEELFGEGFDGGKGDGV